ncbi:MAG: DUF6273 domain-containing protein [Micrococcales bacterium]|nr:DUF6273 domain-containing protein [Micrococcales bacterium]
MAGKEPAWGSPEPEEPVTDTQTWQLREELVTDGCLSSLDLGAVTGPEQDAMGRLMEVATARAQTISLQTARRAGAWSRLVSGYQIMQDGRTIVVSELGPPGTHKDARREYRFTAYLLLSSVRLLDTPGPAGADRGEGSVWLGPYRWRVLRTDGDGRQLLLCDDIFRKTPYHGSEGAEQVRWGQCDLYAWLNGRPTWLDGRFSAFGIGTSGWAEWEPAPDGEWPQCFLEDFTEDEVRRIHPVQVLTGGYAGTVVQDELPVDCRVFLLSLDEAEEWFTGDLDRIAFYRDVPWWWWLRSSSNQLGLAASIGSAGNVDRVGRYACASGGVRPALWLNPPRAVVHGRSES